MQVVLMVEEIRCKLPRVGTRKLYHMLKKELDEIGVGRDKLFDILRANHLLIAPKRSYHITTNSHHRFRKHKNLIENVVPSAPEQQWVSDITYIGKRDNPFYLALVTDAYSKKIVGFDVSDSLDVQSSLKALKKAIKCRKKNKESSLIHYSDRGLQYCSTDYQKILNKNNILCSMTECYDPYANAVAERVNGILKQEFMIEKFGDNLQDKTQLVKDAINKYNNLRPHYSCHYLTPQQMHNQKKLKIRTYKKIDAEKLAFQHQLN